MLLNENLHPSIHYKKGNPVAYTNSFLKKKGKAMRTSVSSHL